MSGRSRRRSLIGLGLGLSTYAVAEARAEGDAAAAMSSYLARADVRGLILEEVLEAIEKDLPVAFTGT